MSKLESFGSEGFLTINKSVDHAVSSQIFEWHQSESSPNCQNVNLGRGGGAR
ncbi:MAG: hypothetical protein LBL39_08205 [Planctomycetaceae bacterium]|jgi:hypothetical protein|nr:hypothetical protein [Planctomycetaceae bacterium]